MFSLNLEMTALFVDTNVLLHFKTFDEIPWDKIAGGDYILQIAPIVLDELDKHKNNQNSKIAQRARMVASKFEEIIDGKEGKVSVQFIVSRPASSYFEGHHLDPKHQDDCLLASILQYGTENLSIAIKLVSDDLGVKLKAKTLGIEVFKPGKELRLPETPDKSQKEIERLQKQVTELKDRIPKVTLAFDNKTTHLKQEVRTNVKTLEVFKADEMMKIKRLHPVMEMKREQPDNNNIFETLNSLNGVLGLSNERRQQYNQQLQEFYGEFEQYLEAKYVYGIKNLMSFRLTFFLYNAGTTPANDIDVRLHLPDGFTVGKKYAEEPDEPKAPFRPKSNYDYEPMNIGFPNLMANIARVNQPPKINFDKPTIRKTNSYEVTYHCVSLKHGLQHKFDPVILQYDNFDDMKNFTIDYRLNISNVPTSINGQLHVVIVKTNQSPDSKV